MFQGNVINAGILEPSLTAATTDLNIEGNWTNTGTFTAGTGSTLKMNGTNPQTMIGSTFNNLVIDNPTGVTLNSAQTITNNLSITTGSKLNLSTFTTHSAGTLRLGGIGRTYGFWGSSSSAAVHQDDTYFALSTGIVAVSNDLCETPPTPVITGSASVCAGVTGSVYSVTDVVGNTHDWTVVGGTITAGTGTNSITVTWGPAGSGTVDVSETETASGCSADATQFAVTINALPTPVITGSASVCAGATGSVYSVTNVVGNTYAWTVAGGTITAGTGTNSITVTWGAAGPGTVDVTETVTATTCSAAATQFAVTINPIPTPVITGSASVCAGATGSVYSVTNVVGNTYAWSVVGGTITAGTGTNSITVTWGAAGPGTVDVTETITATTCSAAATQFAVTINASPTPVITGSASVCAGATGSVYSVTNVVGNTYAWSVVGGTITAGTGTNSITVTWGAAGPGTVDVTETITATTCSAAATQFAVTINPVPTPVITGSASVCAGATGSVYSVTDVVGNTYAWTVVGGTITAGTGTNSITVTWGAAGPATVDVTETVTAGGCSAAATQFAVTINASPTPVITGSASVCTGTTGSVYSVTNVIGNTYAWTVVGGTITAGTGTNSITVTWGAAGPGTVDVTETITAGGCSTAATQFAVTINPVPTPVITGSASVCVGATGSVYSVTDVAGHSYAWTLAGGGSITAGTGTHSITVTWGPAGPGTVNVTETETATGCSTPAAEFAVTINSLPTITGTLTVCANETTQLTGSGTPAAVNPWISLTPAVATVNTTGLVTGVAGGTSDIIYTNNNGCSDTVTVLVTPAAAITSVTGTSPLCIGATATYSANGVVFGGGTGAWSSSNDLIATVSSGGVGNCRKCRYLRYYLYNNRWMWRYSIKTAGGYSNTKLSSNLGNRRKPAMYRRNSPIHSQWCRVGYWYRCLEQQQRIGSHS